MNDPDQDKTRSIDYPRGWHQAPPLGALIAERWELVEDIGEGGMSTVYKARHVIMNKLGAIKFLKGGLSEDPVAVKRFQQEALTSGSLTHPNIVEVYDCGIGQYGAYMILEYLEGVSLTEVMETRAETVKPDQFGVKGWGALRFADEALPVFLEICDGLDYAHKKGVVHRDIKPSNVMLVEPEVVKTGSPDEVQVKLVDFGIAKLLGMDGSAATADSGNLTRTGEVFGSPLYMSPEQCLGRPLDGRADIYSLGCLMYECLTGRKILMGANATETMMRHVEEEADVSYLANIKDPLARPLAEIVARCLARDPDERFDDVGQLRDALRALQNKKTQAVPVVSTLPQATAGGLHPVLIGLALTTVLLIGAIGLYAYSEMPVRYASSAASVGNIPIMLPEKIKPRSAPLAMTSARIFDGGEGIVQNMNLSPERKLQDSIRALKKADELLEKHAYEEARLQYIFIQNILSPIRFVYPLSRGPLLQTTVGIFKSKSENQNLDALDNALGVLIRDNAIYLDAPPVDKIYALEARARVQILLRAWDPAAVTAKLILEQIGLIEQGAQYNGGLPAELILKKLLWLGLEADLLRLGEQPEEQANCLNAYNQALAGLAGVKVPDLDYALKVKKFRAQLQYRYGLELSKSGQNRQAYQAFQDCQTQLKALGDDLAPENQASLVQSYLSLKHFDRLESLKYRLQNHL